jgi:hypothetical protein
LAQNQATLQTAFGLGTTVGASDNGGSHCRYSHPGFVRVFIASTDQRNETNT